MLNLGADSRLPVASRHVATKCLHLATKFQRLLSYGEFWGFFRNHLTKIAFIRNLLTRISRIFVIFWQKSCVILPSPNMNPFFSIPFKENHIFQRFFDESRAGFFGSFDKISFSSEIFLLYFLCFSIFF